MGLARLELATSRLSGVRSNQLSYSPKSITRSAVNQQHSSGLNKDLTDPNTLSNTFCVTAGSDHTSLRKEVIQPQLPLQLPCYDFVPVIDPALGSSPLAVSFPTSGVTNSHDVTGGVYKARERIHRNVLICGY